MISFTETTKNMGIKLLNHGRVLTPENIADANGFEDESYHIKRLRLKGIYQSQLNCITIL